MWQPLNDPGYTLEHTRFSEKPTLQNARLPSGALELFVIMAQTPTSSSSTTLSILPHGIDGKYNDTAYNIQVSPMQNSNTHLITDVPLRKYPPVVTASTEAGTPHVVDKMGRKLMLSGTEWTQERTQDMPFITASKTTSSVETIHLSVVVTPGKIALYKIPKKWTKCMWMTPH